jgi:hypothetical protein
MRQAWITRRVPASVVNTALQQGRSDVACQQQNGVPEIDAAPFSVLHVSLVEYLIEDLMHIGMRLLDLVEQHDAVRTPADRLGQHAAFAITDIPGRRARASTPYAVPGIRKD